MPCLYLATAKQLLAILAKVAQIGKNLVKNDLNFASGQEFNFKMLPWTFISDLFVSSTLTKLAKFSRSSLQGFEINIMAMCH